MGIFHARSAEKFSRRVCSKTPSGRTQSPIPEYPRILPLPDSTPQRKHPQNHPPSRPRTELRFPILINVTGQFRQKAGVFCPYRQHFTPQNDGTIGDNWGEEFLPPRIVGRIHATGHDGTSTMDRELVSCRTGPPGTPPSPRFPTFPSTTHPLSATVTPLNTTSPIPAGDPAIIPARFRMFREL